MSAGRERSPAQTAERRRRTACFGPARAGSGSAPDLVAEVPDLTFIPATSRPALSQKAMNSRAAMSLRKTTLSQSVVCPTFSIPPRTGRRRSRGSGRTASRFQAAVKLRRRAWQGRELPVEPGGVVACPARERLSRGWERAARTARTHVGGDQGGALAAPAGGALGGRSQRRPGRRHS